MEVVNERIIINEKELNKDCEHIQRLVQTKLNLLSFKGKAVCVVNHQDYEAQQVLDIMYYVDGKEAGYLIYISDSLTPHLIYRNGQFEFYYVFILAYHTCNKIKGEKKYIEELLIDEINLKASQLTLINNLLSV